MCGLALIFCFSYDWIFAVSDKPLGIGMIGLGTVGRGVAGLLRDEASLYAERCGRALELRRVMVRDVEKA